MCIGGLLDDWKFCFEPCKDLVGNDCSKGFTCAILPDHPDRPQVCLPGGQQQEGEPCGFGAEACRPGLVCEDTCRKVCAPPGKSEAESSICQAGTICSTIADDAPSFCITPCSPFDDKCGGGDRCNLVSVEAGTWACGPAGSGKAGSDCGVAADCGKGLVCKHDRIGPGSQCLAFCQPGIDADCAPGERCVVQEIDEDRKGQPGVFSFGLCQL
jgi:hypothetical protein